MIPLSWLLVFSNWVHQFAANPLPTFTRRSRPLDRAGARIIRDPPAGQRSARLRDPLQPSSTLRATHRATTPTKRKWMARRLGRVRSKRDKPFDKRDHWGGNNPPPPRAEGCRRLVEFSIYFFFLFLFLLTQLNFFFFFFFFPFDVDEFYFFFFFSFWRRWIFSSFFFFFWRS